MDQNSTSPLDGTNNELNLRLFKLIFGGFNYRNRGRGFITMTMAPDGWFPKAAPRSGLPRTGNLGKLLKLDGEYV